MKFVLLPSYSEHDAWRIETFDKNFLFCFYFYIEILSFILDALSKMIREP